MSRHFMVFVIFGLLSLGAGALTIAQQQGSAKTKQAENENLEAAPHAIVWTCGPDMTVYAADLAGKRMKEIYFDARGVDSLAVDARTAKVYFDVWTSGPADGHRIREMDLATGEARDLITGRRSMSDMLLDRGGNKLYWVYMDKGVIQRANLDGTKVENFLTDLQRPDELAVDEKTGTIYWTEHDGGRVSRINRDGTKRETILTGLQPPVMGLAIHSRKDRLFISLPGKGEIISTKLDGTDRKVVQRELVEPDGIAVDTVNDRIYWTETNKLRSSKLDGTDTKDVVLGRTPKYASIVVVPDLPNLLAPEEPAK